MLRATVFLFLAVTFSQALADIVTPEFFENLPQNSDVNPRILSGWEALPGQIPHQVSLRMVNATGGVGGCGGSIVHRNWVITSAHCTAGRFTLVVRAGLVQLSRPEYLYETTEYYNYPTYDNSRPGVVQPDDISIVKLQRPVTYSNYLKAIRVQPSHDSARNYQNVVMYASGWGQTWTNGPQPETLNWVYLTGISNANCQLTFGTALITANSICARFYNVTSQSTCQGDSGGPLVSVDDGVPTLVGVTSFVAGGNWGCHSGLPAGFIRPAPFLGWFQSITGIDFENIEEEEETTTAPPVTEPEEIPTTPAPTPTPESEEDSSEEVDPTTPAPNPESEEDSSEESDSKEDSDSSESEEDPELSELLKRLEVKVKVKVAMSKYKNGKKEHDHKKNVTISHEHNHRH